MNSDEFEFFATFLRQRSGISLDANKAYLIESRMLSLIEERGIGSLSTLVAQLRSESDPILEDRVVDEMTTNETAFFRDVRPFDMLTDYMIPALLESRSTERRLQIWSAGCSTGQEPYCIAMTLKENFPQLADWTVNIVATDICETAIEQAQEGSYSQLEVNRGLPQEMLDKYFTKSGVRWKLDKDLREMVEFRKLNLIAPITDIPAADIVFIRNVLIYFDLDLQRETLSRVRSLMNPRSYLVLGCAETTLNVDDCFERIEDLPRSGCYRLEKG